MGPSAAFPRDLCFSLDPCDLRFFNEHEELSDEFITWLSQNIGDLQGRWGLLIEGQGWEYNVISTTGITDFSLSFDRYEDAVKFQCLMDTTSRREMHVIRTVRCDNESDYEHRDERLGWLNEFMGRPVSASGWFLSPEKRVWRYKPVVNMHGGITRHVFIFSEADDAMAFKLASGGSYERM